MSDKAAADVTQATPIFFSSHTFDIKYKSISSISEKRPFSTMVIINPVSSEETFPLNAFSTITFFSSAGILGCERRLMYSLLSLSTCKTASTSSSMVSSVPCSTATSNKASPYVFDTNLAMFHHPSLLKCLQLTVTVSYHLKKMQQSYLP